MHWHLTQTHYSCSLKKERRQGERGEQQTPQKPPGREAENTRRLSQTQFCLIFLLMHAESSLLSRKKRRKENFSSRAKRVEGYLNKKNIRWYEDRINFLKMRAWCFVRQEAAPLPHIAAVELQHDV